MELSRGVFKPRHPEPRREKDIFALGKLYAFSLVYSVESRTNQGSAKAGRRKKWAEEIAAELKENAPNATKEELWRMIPKDSGEEDTNGEGGVKRYDGFEVWRGWDKTRVRTIPAGRW